MQSKYHVSPSASIHERHEKIANYMDAFVEERTAAFSPERFDVSHGPGSVALPPRLLSQAVIRPENV